MDATAFDSISRKLSSAVPLAARDIEALTTTRDLVRLGALADERRRAMAGDHVTFVRVLEVPLTGDLGALEVPAPAGEVRLTGSPESAAAAAGAVDAAARRADGVPITGFALEDLVALGGGDAATFHRLVRELGDRGLARVAEVSVDAALDPVWLHRSSEAGVPVARVTIHAPAVARDAAARRVASWGPAAAGAAFAPLPRVPATTPSTGYEDVRQVALARLLVDNISSIQVDWLLYGPKMAQVALTFGANDVDGVSPVDTCAQGRRRAPLEEITRNIRAASLVPVPRNGRFEAIPEKS